MMKNQQAYLAIVDEVVYDGTFVIETDHAGRQSVHPHARMIRDRVLMKQRLTIQQIHGASIILVEDPSEPMRLKVFKDRFDLEFQLTEKRGQSLEKGAALSLFALALEQVRTHPPLKSKAEED